MNAILPEIILINGQFVLEDELVRVNLVLRDNTIAEIDALPSRIANTHDCEGGYLAPGLIELYTDNLERYLELCPEASRPDEAKNLKQHPDVSVPVVAAIEATQNQMSISTSRFF